MPLRLIIEDDEGSTTVVPLANDAITIGRQQGNTIQLTEKNVSRQHARLYPETDGWVIEDLGSYNGIKVNNEVVEQRTKLREGDVVEIGDYHLAITEDVDKSPLNFRTGQAANDGATVEPMLVSSSADLPRLSPEEIAALQSGQQPMAAAPGPILVDSGPVPAGAYHPGYAEPERRRNTGLLVFLGMVLLGVLALGVFWFVNKPTDSGEVATSSAATKPKPKVKTPPGPDKAVVPPAGDPDDGTPEPDSADAGELDDGAVPEADDGSDVVPPDAGDDGAVAEPSDSGAVPDAADDGAEPPVIDDPPDPKPKQPKPKQPKPKQPKPKQPKPKQPPDPPVDVDQLLKEARKEVFGGNASIAYKKAKQAYTVDRSRDTLFLMGNAACRLKDRTKVNYVLKRLKGADKTKIKDICASKGLEI